MWIYICLGLWDNNFDLFSWIRLLEILISRWVGSRNFERRIFISLWRESFFDIKQFIFSCWFHFWFFGICHNLHFLKLQLFRIIDDWSSVTSFGSLWERFSGWKLWYNLTLRLPIISQLSVYRKFIWKEGKLSYCFHFCSKLFSRVSVYLQKFFSYDLFILTIRLHLHCLRIRLDLFLLFIYGRGLLPEQWGLIWQLG